ncbi:hypothetical protein [Rhizobium sp. LjRoot254]|uniref:hypothetical protein n=1 Tax=Rhizobium sp. LjRoot254 TaxID=3342297 RepID=UPI003ECDABB3
MSDKPRGVIYTGVTSDLTGRIWEHRNHVHQGFTSKYRAERLVSIRISFLRSNERSR